MLASFQFIFVLDAKALAVARTPRFSMGPNYDHTHGAVHFKRGCDGL